MVSKNYFAAVDQYSKEDDTILMGRTIGSDGPTSSFTLQYFPIETKSAMPGICAIGGLKFDECMEGYQCIQKANGKPDRSRGKPYKEYYEQKEAKGEHAK